LEVPVHLRVHGARLLKKIHQLKRMYRMMGFGLQGWARHNFI
jgi:hypothetical protein